MSTQIDLLEVLDAYFPDSYLQPIRDIGPGYEIYQALAGMLNRIQTAIANTDADAFIASAQGAGGATGTVQFSRPTDAGGAVTMQAGTIVRSSLNGAAFVTVADAVFGATDLGPISAPAVALGYGYEYNVPGAFTAPNGDIDPGGIDTIDLPLLIPVYQDQTIVVTNTDAMTGGRPATLDLHGKERDLPRYANEGDPAYRARLSMVTDTVSPAAIRRQLFQYIYPTGLPWIAFENFSDLYQECYDAPITYVTLTASSSIGDTVLAVTDTSGMPASGSTVIDVGTNAESFTYTSKTSTSLTGGALSNAHAIGVAVVLDPQATDAPTYSANRFVFDDPSPDYPVVNRWLGIQDFVGAFTVEIERPPWIEDWGFAYDDTSALVDADQTSNLGRRSVSAYDVPTTLPEPSMLPFYDVTDFGIDNLLSGLLDMLNRTKAYGVLATVIVADPGTLT